MKRTITGGVTVVLALLFPATGASMAHGMAKTSVVLAVPAVRRRWHS